MPRRRERRCPWHRRTSQAACRLRPRIRGALPRRLSARCETFGTRRGTSDQLPPWLSRPLRSFVLQRLDLRSNGCRSPGARIGEIALWGFPSPAFEFFALVGMDRPTYRIAHPRLCPICEIDEVHLVLREAFVAYLAALDVQVAEVLAGLDVRVRQSPVEFGDDDFFVVGLNTGGRLADVYGTSEFFQRL